MEATGRYGEALALFLSTNKLKVSVVNPTRIKAFARSEGARVKTDKADAGVIARFCKAHSPEIWLSPSAETQSLRDLYRCLQDLQDDRQRCQNRMEKLENDKESFKTWMQMVETYNEKIENVEKQIKALINSNDDLHKKEEALLKIEWVTGKTD
jgi:transposase